MRTTHVQIVMHSHVNNTNRLFGGRLMEWIDVTAASAARRHAASDVTTATVDALEFIAPVYLNDLLILEAEVTWTGRPRSKSAYRPIGKHSMVTSSWSTGLICCLLP